MTDRDTPETTPAGFGDLPLQPTGSGVADLEIAYEQMKLTEVADPDAATADPRVADDADPMPTGRDDDADSEAHPS